MSSAELTREIYDALKEAGIDPINEYNKGMEKGIEEGRQDDLIRLIEKRFRKLKKVEIKRIRNCRELNELDNIFDYAIDADNIEKILKMIK